MDDDDESQLIDSLIEMDILGAGPPTKWHFIILLVLLGIWLLYEYHTNQL